MEITVTTDELYEICNALNTVANDLERDAKRSNAKGHTLRQIGVVEESARQLRARPSGPSPGTASETIGTPQWTANHEEITYGKRLARIARFRHAHRCNQQRGKRRAKGAA